MKHDAVFNRDCSKALTLEELERQRHWYQLGEEVRELHIALRIDNLVHIARAYGNGAAQFIQSEVAAYFTGLIAEGYFDSGSVTNVTAGQFLLVLRGTARRDKGQSLATRFAQAIMVLGCTAIEHDGTRIHVAVSSRAARPLPAAKLPEHDAQRLQEARDVLLGTPGSAALPSEETGWAASYRRDMATAAQFFAAVHEQGLQVAWQPISSSVDPDHVLYHEALLRGVDDNGQLVSQAAVIGVLERLGLICVLDYLMVDHALHELQRSSHASIGVNISALSAKLDPWWCCILGRLAQNPDMANRLNVELTETAAIGSRTDLVHFARALQETGCALVIDDFGVGNASFWSLFGLCPQVVKIDGSFLRRALNGDRHQQILHHLAGLARSIARVVVIEGVETVELSRLADSQGLQWQQGYFHGFPSIRRPWLNDLGGLPSHTAGIPGAAMSTWN